MSRTALIPRTGLVVALTTGIAVLGPAGFAPGYHAAGSPVTPVRDSHASAPTSTALDAVVDRSQSDGVTTPTHARNRPAPTLLVRIPSTMPIRSRPGGGRVVGSMPAVSKYYHAPIVAWVIDTSADGKYGEVAVPYNGSQAAGWIRLSGLRRAHTVFSVTVDLSRHQLVVERRGVRIMQFRAGIGAPASPSPPGRYFVTDRVSLPSGGPLGSFAFGISGIQIDLPAGWSGGDQLAIHGTSNPATIGADASAGCVHVSEEALRRLEPILRLGTPVIIVR